MKYETAEAFGRAVKAYFDRISYQVPAVIATATGEIDKEGNILWERKLLTTPPDSPGGIGRPVTTTKWLEPPNVAGLCLHLGISRDTWWRYAKKPGYRDSAEWAKLQMESYWVASLENKSAKGAAFALENCYGWKGDWKTRQEVGVDPDTRKELGVEAFLRKEAKKEPKEGGGPYEY